MKKQKREKLKEKEKQERMDQPIRTYRRKTNSKIYLLPFWTYSSAPSIQQWHHHHHHHWNFQSSFASLLIINYHHHFRSSRQLFDINFIFTDYRLSSSLRSSRLRLLDIITDSCSLIQRSLILMPSLDLSMRQTDARALRLCRYSMFIAWAPMSFPIKLKLILVRWCIRWVLRTLIEPFLLLMDLSRCHCLSIAFADFSFPGHRSSFPNIEALQLNFLERLDFDFVIEVWFGFQVKLVNNTLDPIASN